MNIPDVDWIDTKTSRVLSQLTQNPTGCYKKYNKRFDILFCVHWTYGIDGVRGRATLSMRSDREPLIPELPPSHYKTVELIIGEKSDYAEAWASTLHEMGHMFSHPHKIGNGHPREKFLMEVEAWNFAKSHWGQAPPEKPFPIEGQLPLARKFQQF